ncbi:DUF1564 family protein [Leptospira ellisii]|uniref:DUF1564 family protein n=1 Tax=Leptospira ellisii TaxID=2023197 RepID=A0A2N0BEK4_9LEPT|nr:DUF1564 family protein [Leptospira ellisii]MDV6234314.1 DUF1564 family protein [Leptospira ellisii]PJZ94881.1 hypothetical protein CH379_00440 [Leptospira ellisii]PKA05086.1 hypothetical protein CH375_07160 [Leptospira ellisii]
MNREKKFTHGREFRKGRFTADLYVPLELYSYTIFKIKKNRNLTSYLKALLKNYKTTTLKTQKPSTNERTAYQKGSQSLMRISFRPDNLDWAELRTIARYLGVSMCKTFVLLMETEKQETLKSRIPFRKLRQNKIRIVSLLQKFSRKGNRIDFKLIADW